MDNKQEPGFFKKKKTDKISVQSLNEINDNKNNKSLFVTGGAIVILLVVYILTAWMQTDPSKVALLKINEFEKSKMNRQEIHNYLIQTEGLSNEISQSINELSDMKSEESFKKMEKKFVSFKERAKTDVYYLVPLQDYYVSQIILEEKMMEDMMNEGVFKGYKIRESKKDYNRNIPSEQDIIQALFDKVGIYYEINKDGSFYYELTERKTK